jgi:hypothetical protein
MKLLGNIGQPLVFEGVYKVCNFFMDFENKIPKIQFTMQHYAPQKPM